MNKNKQDKVCVCFKIENGLQIYIDIPKFATAKGLVDICSKQFRIDKQQYRINLTRDNTSLTSGDNGQVLEFNNGDVINVSIKEKWIELNFILASKQKISLEIENGSSVKEVVEVLRKQYKIPNNYLIHLLSEDARVLDNENYLFTDGETIVVFPEDKNKSEIMFEDKNKSEIKWNFIFSSSPFLVLTLLALILQWHIAFVIIFLIISLVLVAIGLWPKIKTCCPREISSSYETENQNSSEENISQNPNLEQDYQYDRNIIDE